MNNSELVNVENPIETIQDERISSYPSKIDHEISHYIPSVSPLLLNPYCKRRFTIMVSGSYHHFTQLMFDKTRSVRPQSGKLSPSEKSESVGMMKFPFDLEQKTLMFETPNHQPEIWFRMKLTFSDPYLTGGSELFWILKLPEQI